MLPDLNSIENSLRAVGTNAPSIGQRLTGIDNTLSSARGDTANVENLLVDTDRNLSDINNNATKLGLVPGAFAGH